jgi:hypothetical protein
VAHGKIRGFKDMTKPINSLLREVLAEVKKFEEQYPREEVFLLQAAEKCWVAFNLLVEKIMGYEMMSGSDVKSSVRALNRLTPDKNLMKAYCLTHDLHIYHYEGRASPDIIKSKVRQTERLIQKLKEKYKISGN